MTYKRTFIGNIEEGVIVLLCYIKVFFIPFILLLLRVLRHTIVTLSRDFVRAMLLGSFIGLVVIIKDHDVPSKFWILQNTRSQNKLGKFLHMFLDIQFAYNITTAYMRLFMCKRYLMRCIVKFVENILRKYIKS